MGSMEDLPQGGGPGTLPVVRLSSAGQTYVAVVGLLALLSTLADGRAWYVALVLLTLPLTPVALWVGFYAAIAMGAAVGHGPDAVSWPVTLVWVVVWSLTAWLNARMLEKVLRRGWAGRWVPTPEDA
jgi:hypothetical protein